jgi:type II secretory pathway component GspD/PulD (secretin)
MSPKTYRLALCLGVFFEIACQTVWAQPGPSNRQQQADELRQQIERMEMKLRGLEESDKEKRGIAQIGGTTVRAADDTRLVVRMYDLSELFTVAPAYVVSQKSDLMPGEKNLFPQVHAEAMATGGMGGFGGGGFGGAFSVPDKPQSVRTDRPPHLAQFEARTSVSGLVQTIQSVISPTNWDQAGGPMSISQLGNALIVSADTNTHSQIEKLLDLFRKRWGTLKTVSVRAWWVPLTENQLNELVAGAGAADRLAFGLVDEAAFKKLLDSHRQDNSPSGYRAAITCYNGQTVGAIAGDQTIAVTDLQAVTAKGEAGAVKPIAYSPVVQMIQEGAALQVTPIVTTSGKFLILDIHSRVNQRAPRHSKLVDARDGGKGDGNSPAEVVAALDRPRLNVQRLSTTLRVPVGATMLIGGMTMSDNATAETPTLYLFVKLMVQELRDETTSESVEEEKE